jgi:hypothetical protein
MSQHHLDFPPANRAEDTAAVNQIRELDTLRDFTQVNANDSSSLAAADRDQLERDIAAIERASATLRRAEPELESWIDPPAAAMHKPRPLWLLIGVLWLSTALVTIGAVFAISALVG